MKLQSIFMTLPLVASATAAALPHPKSSGTPPNCSWAKYRASCDQVTTLSKCKRDCEPSNRGARAGKCSRVGDWDA